MSPTQHRDLADTVADGQRDTYAVPPPPSPNLVEVEDLAVTFEHPGRYTGPRRKGAPPAESPIELGRGGIGRVLIAHDAHLGREVAVKELLAKDEDAGATPTRPDNNPRHSLAAARFLREARLTGQLEHPNIVPVYELGRRKDGTLYYTMKVVRGRTMADALNEAKSLAQRLKLLKHYTDLCDAIAYAHSRAVIHRDIKPENVMVGEFGETVVLDWGIAKSRDGKDVHGADMARALQDLHDQKDLAQTSDGTLLGTPLFMSPEQATGQLDEVDERSDVWALGVVLYELLTGTTPFTGKNAIELLVDIVKKPLTPVREREPAAPPELASIAEKALSKDKTQRYPDARAMADELRAYLTGGRVRAYEYGLWTLVRRWAARHKAALAVAVVGVAALIALGVWAFASIAQERDAAMAAKTVAEEAQGRAEAAHARAAAAEGRATVARDGAEELVRYMLDELQDKLEPLGQTSLLDGVAGAVQAYYAKDPMDDSKDVVRLRNRASVIALLGDLARVKGDLIGAGKAYEEAEKLRDKLLELVPDDHSAQADRAESWRRRGMLRRFQGELPGAAEALEKARAMRVKLLAAEPTSFDYARAVIESELDRGEIAALTGELGQAVSAYTKAVDDANALAQKSDDPRARYDLTVALDALGTAQLDGGQPREAIEVLERSLAIKKDLVQSAPGNLEWQQRVALSYSRLGEAYNQLGDKEKRRELWREALTITEALSRQDPANVRWLRDVAVYWNREADAELEQGHLQEAVAAYQRSLDYVRSLAAKDITNTDLQRDVEVGHNRIGDTLVMLNRSDAALAEFEEARNIADQLARRDTTNTRWRHDFALCLTRVALARWRMGDADGALPLQEQALKILDSLVAADATNASWTRDRDAARATLATIRVGQGDVGVGEQNQRDTGSGLKGQELLAPKPPHQDQRPDKPDDPVDPFK